MNKTIYLIIEIEKRELDSKILLGILAAKKGFKVAITKKTRLYEKIHIIRSGIIFLKSFGSNIDKYLFKIKKYGHILTGLDEEGLQVYDKDWLIGKRFSNNLVKNIKFIFAWGLNSKKIYLDYFKKFSNKIDVIAAGNPRIDILKRKYNKHYNSEVKIIKKKYKNFILIATQFLKYNRKNGFQDRIILDKNKYSKKEIYNWTNSVIYQKKNFYEFEKTYEYLNKKFGKKLFLIRPHPGEDEKYYNKIAKKYKNFKIINSNDSIIPWILASETLISNNCTTAIESFLLKKNSINFIPYRDKRYEYDLTKLLSINIVKKEELYKSLLKKRFNRKNIIKKNDIFKAKKYLLNIDNIDSVNEILKKLKSFDFEATNDNKYENIFCYLYFFIKTKFKNFIYFLFSKNTLSYKTQYSKRNNLNKKNIQKRVNNFSKHIDKKNKYIVKEKYYGLFYIEKVPL